MTDQQKFAMVRLSILTDHAAYQSYGPDLLIEDVQALLAAQARAEADYAMLRAVARRCFAEDTGEQDMLNLWNIAASVDHPGVAITERLNRQNNALEAARAALVAAYTELREWHDRAHSRNRPPDMNCTGCAIWPTIAGLAAALGFDPLVQHDPPMAAPGSALDVAVRDRRAG